MLKVFSAQNSFEVHNLKNALESQGVKCEIRGEHLRTGIGDLPPIECWAELWIVEDSMKETAERIIASGRARQMNAWTCPGCGESVDGQLGQCWNCQADCPSLSA